MRADLHQHVWPARLVEALRVRRQPPRLDVWTVHPIAEPPFSIDPGDADPDGRAGLARRDGVDLVAVSLSPALGVETMDGEHAQPLLDAWHDAAGELGPPFRVWASCVLSTPDPQSIRRDLARPWVCGLQLPATALGSPHAVTVLGPVLAEVERSGKPVLVHPGPASPVGVVQPASPSWWSPVVDYVAQLHAAWHAWQVAGAASHPDLRVGFVALAGLAPLHHERLAARGGPRRLPLGQGAGPGAHLFYETSSYGPTAVRQLVDVVGSAALMHGSDRPNALPATSYGSTDLDRDLFSINPVRFLEGDLQ